MIAVFFQLACFFQVNTEMSDCGDPAVKQAAYDYDKICSMAFRFCEIVIVVLYWNQMK